MPTLHDVAQRAGVAPMTVSRVINNSGPVAPEVRARVQAAVAELGYVPNARARSLRSRRTMTLALVLTDLTNPFFTTVARGVAAAAGEAGYLVLVGHTDERPDEETRYLRLIAEQRVDGLLWVPTGGADEAFEQVRRVGIPTVILDRRTTLTGVDQVRCDSVGGARRLAELLVGLGHRRLAVLAGPSGVSTSADRVAGFRAGLAPAAVEPVVYHGRFEQASGAALCRRALAATPRPTALFAVNNFLAIGALQALRADGARVPEEVSLVGFDDLPPALVTFPFLTVAAQPAEEMGRRAVACLLARLSGDTMPPTELILPTELIVRESSGPPPPGELT